MARTVGTAGVVAKTTLLVDDLNLNFNDKNGNIVILCNDGHFFRCHSIIITKLSDYIKSQSDKPNGTTCFEFDYTNIIINYTFKILYSVFKKETNINYLLFDKSINSSRHLTLEENNQVLELLDDLSITNEAKIVSSKIINNVLTNNLNDPKIIQTMSNIYKKYNDINVKQRITNILITESIVDNTTISQLDDKLKNIMLLILLEENKRLKIEHKKDQTLKTNIKSNIQKLKHYSLETKKIHTGWGNYERVFEDTYFIKIYINQLYDLSAQL